MSAKSTWMSGGSGSGVYDPVTTGDNVRVQFSDQDEGWLRIKGGRKYNFGTYRNSGLKGLCDDIRNRSRPKCLLISFISTAMLILLIIIIVIEATGQSKNHSSTGYVKWSNKIAGLNFRPIGKDGTIFIPLSLEKGNENSYQDYIKRLDEALESYKTIHIHNGPNIVCNKTYNPANAVCQEPLTVFGTHCVPTHKYGYAAGQPCALLYFTLPPNYTVRSLLPKDGQDYVDAEAILGDRFSTDHVGISCEPATPEDKKYVGNTSALGDAIDYNPKEGFPTYMFRKRVVDQFVPPAVMVQFRSIRDTVKSPHSVRMTCTAWGKAMDPNGKVFNKGMFTTSLVFLIH